MTTPTDVFSHAACGFTLRELADNGYHRFTPLTVRTPRGDGRIRTTMPPIVGDTVFLSCTDRDLSNRYRIIDREWMHPSWGSVLFPIDGGIRDGGGASLDYLVEKVGPGWYATEDPNAAGDDDG